MCARACVHVCMCACACVHVLRVGGGWPVCVSVPVCGPVTAGSRPGHINFTPLQTGSGSPEAAVSGNGKQMGPDGGHMGLGAGAHSSLPAPPGSPLPAGPPSGGSWNGHCNKCPAASVEPAQSQRGGGLGVMGECV